MPEIIQPDDYKRKYELAVDRIEMWVNECNKLQEQLKNKNTKIKKLKRKIKKLNRNREIQGARR